MPEESNQPWLWHSADELPPEKFVLLCIKRPHLDTPDMNIGHYDRYRGHWRTRIGEVTDKVTHWAELPHPPTSNL